MRNTIGLVLAVTLLPWCAVLFWAEVSNISTLPMYAGALGSGVGLAVLLVWWRKPNWFIHTFIHEAAHALLCWCLFVRIRSFQVSDGQGGMVIHQKVDPIRMTFIALAPYTLPLLLTPILLWYWYSGSDGSYAELVNFIIGFLYVHHLHGLYHNIRINFWGKQADLTKVGKILSIVIIACALLSVSTWTIQIVW